MHTVPPHAASNGPPAPPAPSRGLVAWLPRDLVIGFALVILLNYAVAFFDEIRKPLEMLAQAFTIAFVIYIVTRVFWSWWRRQPSAMVSLGAWVALAVAVVSWLDVALAHGVKSINEGNYGLIIIGPAAMFIGLLVSLAGLAATGLGVIVAITALTRAVPKRGLLVVVGITAAILNVAAILQVIRIYSRG